MLADYFSLCIDVDARLECVPQLAHGVKPIISKIPLFMCNLTRKVSAIIFSRIPCVCVVCR